MEKGSWAEGIVKKDEIHFLLKFGKLDLVEVKIVSGNPDYGFDILSDGAEKQIFRASFTLPEKMHLTFYPAQLLESCILQLIPARE